MSGRSGEADQAAEEELLRVLRQLAGGRTVRELAIELRDLVAAVHQTARQGHLTLRLYVRPAAKHQVPSQGGGVLVTDEITVSAPRPDRPQTLFYRTPDNGLSTHNPARHNPTGDPQLW
ncbi:hypothetical protein [Actinokineospora sp. UTMC 2448]|uniref:hypothetical protein n=1 Tax=Actinokineospora sp. UTMC 2448 TaxID=2268449 RepID=UPI002164E457|nr:hypothetical protein [Actinokineospora sp. UTMC 2448]UVS81815.1 hypothetical protein Actkin_05579 [Actinokineospora sp. UTMC 2448]